MSSRYEVWQGPLCIAHFASAWHAKRFAHEQAKLHAKTYEVVAYYAERIAEFRPADPEPRPTVREALHDVGALPPLTCNHCPVLRAAEQDPKRRG